MRYKKITITISILLAFIAIFLVNYTWSFRVRAFSDFYKIGTNKIDQISIINGNNGHALKITNKKQIKYVCSYFSKLKFKKIISKPSTGWSYRFMFYRNKKEQIDITFIGSDTCKINLNTKYDIINSHNMHIISIINKLKKKK